MSMMFRYLTRLVISNMECEMRHIECEPMKLASAILPDGKEVKNITVFGVSAYGKIIMYTYLCTTYTKIKTKQPVDVYVIWDHNGKVLSCTPDRKKYEAALRITMSFWNDVWKPTVNNRRKAANDN